MYRLFCLFFTGVLAFGSVYAQTKNEVKVSTAKNSVPANGFKVLAPTYDLVNVDGRTNVIKINGAAAQWNVMEYSLANYRGKPITIHLSADVMRTGKRKGMGWVINNEPDYPNMTMANDPEPGVWYNLSGTYTVIPTNNNPMLSLSKWEQKSSNTFFYVDALCITIETWDHTPASILTAAGEENSNGTRNYFVSAGKGSDGGNGTQARPFSKIADAMYYVKPGDTVLVDSGVYREKFIVPSGSAGRPVTLSAMPGAKVAVTTAVQITPQWKPYNKNVYIADISRYAQYIDTNFPQLFAERDGFTDSMVEARYPNMGASMSAFFDYKRDVAQKGTNKSTVTASQDIPADIAGARVVIWPGEASVPGWTSAVSAVKSVNGRSINLLHDITGSTTEEAHAKTDPYTPYPENPFYVTGALSLLDERGEYYLNAQSNQLYFYPPWNGAPDMRTLSLRSKNDTAILAANTSYVIVKDISVFGSGINMKDSHHNVLDNCRVFYAQNYIKHFFNDLADNVVVTGSHNRITKCEFGNTAGKGIVLSGDDNVFTNNFVHDTNYSGSQNDGGVVVLSAKRLEISHNTMINQGGAHVLFAYGNVYDRCAVRNNYFENNAILVPDGSGAFYTIGTNGGGTEIYNNFIVVGNRGDNGTMHKMRIGLYIDDKSFNYTVRHNIVNGGTGSIQHGMTNSSIPPKEGNRFINNTLMGASDYGFGFHAVVFNPNAKHITICDNLLVNVGIRDVSYGAVENSKWTEYNGDFVNGTIPVTQNKQRRMISSGNARGTVDGQYRPSGNTPGIGAIPKGGELFEFGADWVAK